MSQFIESIKLLNGEFYRLKLHQERINQIFDDFFPQHKAINLSHLIENQIVPKEGFFKMRIVFDSEIKNIEFLMYQLPIISSLKLIETELQSTYYKSAEREKINIAFSNRGKCDDILFVKNGLITDTSYCNVAFFDGENWFTSKIPLINGTQRKNLLQKKIIIEKDLTVNDIVSYQSICLFNSMIEFGEIVFSVKNLSK
jgi:4-amino-4-deoxychorismate lyase